MDRQQPHRYMPPPPPSTADPYHHQLVQPVPQPGPWYPGQFQYPPPSQQHSPPPPLPYHQQWAPTPPYPAPPYHAHPLHDQYQPHPAHRPFPPPYHTNSQIPQLYPQEWGNANRGHHQGCEYPVHQNEDDWAAKARAWAAAKATTDYQHSQSQIYQDQYPQTSDPRYPDVLQPSISASSHQQYPPSAAPSHRPHMADSQESGSIISVQSSFVPDDHLAYSARDGNLGGDSNAVFSSQEMSTTSSAFHLQEVPSSYSSVTGVKEAGDQSEQFYRSFPLSVDSNQAPHHVHPPLHAAGRSILEPPHYAVGKQLNEASIDPSDQPLVFVHRFNHNNHDPRTEPSYIHTDSTAATSSHTWIIPSVPGTVFPPIPSSQHDSPIPSSVPGHSATLFGRMPGPSFQPPPVPSVGTPFGIGAGSVHHPTTAFPVDVYGVPSNPERPKKASVPNWLREEIIKNKAVITSSSEYPKEETESIEDEAVDKSLRKADQGDSKSIDSTKLSEEEDDDEDDVEEARMAAINQEIKRILTEVLLKVTDELFDEIATKVLNEDDLTLEVDQIVAHEPKPPPSASAFPTPKAVAEVILPAKELENEDGNRKSVSIFPGDVLGLGSYASDDEEDDKNTVHPQQPGSRKLLEDKRAVENGRSEGETKGYDKDQRKEEGGTRKLAPNGVAIHNGKEEADASGTDNISGEKAMRTESPPENTNGKKPVTDDFRGKETRKKQEKNDTRGETNRSSYGKDILKEVDSDKGRIEERENDRHRQQDGGRHMKREREREREKADDRNDSKRKMKDQGDNSREKAKEPDSRKRSIHPSVKKDRKERERDRRANVEDDGGDRKRELKKDEMGERSRQRLSSESRRHTMRHSPSVGSRGRSSKDNPVAASHANHSSEESSDDSKRKLHSKGRKLSPSPNRSRRRQDSRSPHSKHSQCRHSPYSSLETIRRRRSRSRSPIRRQR